MRPVFLCATAVFTVAGSIVGQVLVQRHYEQQRFHLNSETVHALLEEKEGIRLYPVPLSTDEDLSGFASANDTDFISTSGETEANDEDGPILPAVDTIALFDGPQPVAEPDPESSNEASAESVEVEIRITDKESDTSPAVPALELPVMTGPKLAELLPSHPPAELSAPMNAAPLTISEEERQRIRAIIRDELPKASQDEQDIWLEQLQGMSPQMIRELLRMRKLFSIEQPLADDPSDLPPLGPFEDVPEEGTMTIELPWNFMPPKTTAPSAVATTFSSIQIARDVVFNNIANANTVGFKRSIVQFEAMPYLQHRGAGDRQSGPRAPVGISTGYGVQIGGVYRDHSHGDLQQTGRPLDLAIDGDGFFQVSEGSQIRYARAGNFIVTSDGQLAMASCNGGGLVEPRIVVPLDSTEVSVSEEGIVSVMQPGSAERASVGQLQLARFANPAALAEVGENLFAAIDETCKPTMGSPNVEGRGRVRQGFLEASNVKLDDELRTLEKLKAQFDALKQAAALFSDQELNLRFGDVEYTVEPSFRMRPDEIIELPRPSQFR